MAYAIKGSEEITNSADMIDGREVSDRIDYLESEREPLESAVTDCIDALESALEEDKDSGGVLMEALGTAKKELAEWEASEEGGELQALKSLYDDISRDSTLIRESYFEDYAQQLADDLGYTSSKMQWPYTCIDWEKAAHELQSDYSCVDFDGVTYYTRG